MNLKSHNWNALELGAVCGLLFGILSEIIFRSIFLYEGYVHPPIKSAEFSIDMAPYPFSWWYLPLLWLILVALASYFVHRYLARHIKSSIWLWQVVGIVAVLEGCSFSFILVVYGWYSQFGHWEARVLWEGIIDSTLRELKIGLFFLPFLLVFNLIFVMVLRRWRLQFQ